MSGSVPGPSTGAALGDAALALVGTPYRPGGRDSHTGLDCLGVLAAALAAIGRPAPLPARLSLRRRGEIDGAAMAGAAGLHAASGPIARGDVLLVRCSAVQLHLLIALDDARYVHAHAGLRRVVTGPRDPDWSVVGCWRLFEPR